MTSASVRDGLREIARQYDMLAEKRTRGGRERDVGRAAINGLATANPAPFDRLPQLGWRQRP
jgi:hypothetical protein